MTFQFGEIEAITLDFYNTLVFHKQGSGRGATLMDYLAKHRLEADRWQHQVLYDVFQHYLADYSPDLPEELKWSYIVRFTERVFERLNVSALEGAAADHARDVWAILGPASLGVFPDVLPALKALRGAGYPLALVSNWQCGLSHFCDELGLGDAFDHIVVSAEVGSEKPASEMFHIACRRLGVSPGRALHVGDTVVDDIEGAYGAGTPAILVRRDDSPYPVGIPTISNLGQLADLLGVDAAS